MLANKLLGAGKAVEPAYIEDVFSTWLYTGNGSTQTITNGIDLAGKGGLVWTKERSPNSRNHFIGDSARDSFRNYLYPNLTNPQSGLSGSGFDISSVSSTGYSLGADNYTWNNESGSSQVSWTFRKQQKFFDVVTWTGNGTNPRQISHNLGSVPGCIIIKSTTRAENWTVYHRSLGNTGRIALNTTDSAVTGTGVWASTSPTSTTFTVSADNLVNFSGDSYVAYLFAHNAGGFGLTGTDNVISCGSYTGNGANPGPVINLGWEPQWLLIKNASDVANWLLFDTMRGIPTGSADALLIPNLINAETANPNPNLDITATGFYTNSTSNTINASGNTYIYIAIRRGPMKTPTNGTQVFRPNTGSASATVTTNFPVDLLISAVRGGDSTYQSAFVDRLRGIPDVNNSSTPPILVSSKTNAEANGTGGSFFSQNWTNSGYQIGFWGSDIFWSFRRAPGFFDVVCYTGTGTATTQAHNLGVAPELMIVRSRNNATNWFTYTASAAPNRRLLLETTAALSTDANIWNNTAPTSSVFSIGGSGNISTWTYVAYLFATLAGVSKVGSYTGTGTTQQINCGFTNGARFVMVKATSTTGDWIVVDTARGLVSGNDPTLALNSTAAEVTTNDWFDPYSAGFELSSASGNLANTNGVSYIFLAIS